MGVGAALLQPGPDGALQPVAYASRILNNAEQNYSQIERESLAIIFGVTKYRQYLLGRHFKLLTDHKPLITLLGEHKPVPLLAAARIKRWALLLAAYDYTIEFIGGKDNVFADFLSRKPNEYKQSAAEQVTVNVMFIEEDQFLNASVVAMETMRDPVLGRCYSLLSRVGPIIWNQCSNLTTAKDLNSLMKMVSSCGTHELFYQSHYRPSYGPICKQNTWVWLK